MVNLDTVVDVQVNKRKKLQKNAKVVEAFKNKYVNVELDEHIFHLLWNSDD